jgi:hypothetical protein
MEEESSKNRRSAVESINLPDKTREIRQDKNNAFVTLLQENRATSKKEGSL